jgi:aspartate 1-decarboxylase
MLITVLKSKIHRATVIEANLDYHGSCSIDKDLMYSSGIEEHEQIHIYNINNGERFITYAIPSDVPGMIALNGSAARLGMVNDLIIICAYGQVKRTDDYRPKVVFVDDKNMKVES